MSWNAHFDLVNIGGEKCHHSTCDWKYPGDQDHYFYSLVSDSYAVLEGLVDEDIPVQGEEVQCSGRKMLKGPSAICSLISDLWKRLLDYILRNPSGVAKYAAE